MRVYVPIIDKQFEVNNNILGFNKLVLNLIKHYSNLSNVIISFEATGGYDRKLREFLKTNKLHFTTVHPNKVRSYAKAKGLLAKTDYMDSIITDYAVAFSLSVKQDYSTPSQQKLRALIQRREQLILVKNQESNRLEVEDDQFIITLIKEHVINS